MIEEKLEKTTRIIKIIFNFRWLNHSNNIVANTIMALVCDFLVKTREMKLIIKIFLNFVKLTFFKQWSKLL